MNRFLFAIFTLTLSSAYAGIDTSQVCVEERNVGIQAAKDKVASECEGVDTSRHSIFRRATDKRLRNCLNAQDYLYYTTLLSSAIDGDKQALTYVTNVLYNENFPIQHTSIYTFDYTSIPRYQGCMNYYRSIELMEERDVQNAFLAYGKNVESCKKMVTEFGLKNPEFKYQMFDAVRSSFYKRLSARKDIRLCTK